MMTPARQAKVPIRRSLVAAAFAGVLGSLLAFMAAIWLFVVRPYSQDLATSQLRIAAEQVESRLRGLVERVEGVVRQNRDWGRRGLIDERSPERFNALLQPLLQHGPRLSSAVVAHESGRELLLLAGPDGGWTNRLTDPAAQGRRARFLNWDAEGRLLKDEWREFDYDARTRPWFQGGMGLASDEAVFWSEPYLFRSSQEPGLSVVVRWTAADGSRYAMTSDLKLIDLSRFTRDTVAGRNGFVAVLAGDGRLLAVPRVPSLVDDAAIRKAVLQPAEQVGVPALARSLALWQQSGRRDGELLRFETEGEAWLARIQHSRFGGQTFWVATLAPESALRARHPGPGRRAARHRGIDAAAGLVAGHHAGTALCPAPGRAGAAERAHRPPGTVGTGGRADALARDRCAGCRPRGDAPGPAGVHRPPGPGQRFAGAEGARAHARAGRSA